jgi:hypothetical protein
MLPMFSEFDQSMFDEGCGARKTARLLKVSAAKVIEVRRMSAATADPHP